MNENMKKLKEVNIVIGLVDKIQNGNIMTALQEIDQILLDPSASAWLKECAASQRIAAIARYRTMAFETAHPELFARKEGE